MQIAQHELRKGGEEGGRHETFHLIQENFNKSHHVSERLGRFIKDGGR